MNQINHSANNFKSSLQLEVVLVGNPNSGKTTLFNQLTGKQQAVGNWCGVTVELNRGRLQIDEKLIEVVDLPGCYNSFASGDLAVDEQITIQYLNALSSKTAAHPTLIVNVVDATELERHLYLSLQLLERGLPVIIALNMMDAAEKKGIKIDIKLLEQELGCTVIPLIATTEAGIQPLRKIIPLALFQNTTNKSAGHLGTETTNATKISESAVATEPAIAAESLVAVELVVATEPAIADDPAIAAEILAAKARFDRIHLIVKATVKACKDPDKITWTERIDKIVLNRFLGIPIFLAAMYAVFVFSIRLCGSLQDFFNIASKTICIDLPSEWLLQLEAPNWLVGLLPYGIGQGINTTVSFIPVIAGMFISLSFLESSGYMARAAFVMDKIMRMVGLPGKSFVPMIIGFGCNVPAVMATRTLENYRERVLTVLMSPFMSCGARLAIYALFVAAFFPQQGQNIIFGLYLIGIAAALMTGFALQKTLLQGKQSSLIIELPPYRWPSFKILMRTTWNRLKQFILKAGALIIPLCAIIGTLGSLPDKTNLNQGFTIAGRFMTPLFSPMGIREENWPATVGLLTGMLAKEVVGTLTALYAEEDHHAKSTNLPKSINSNVNEIKAQETVGQGTLGMMVERFGSKTAAFAYLLFVLLYFPCVSVVATISRELNRFWAIFSVLWTTGIAYSVAVLFYQTATFLEHPVLSLSWIFGLFVILAMSFWGVRKLIAYKTNRNNSKYKPLPTAIFVQT